MNIIRDKQELQKTVATVKQAGKQIGLVPTMGALHNGHLSLVQLAKQHCDICIVSIFVNPCQFAPHEDLTTYPRSEANDLAAIDAIGADIAYIPDTAQLYPEGFSLSISTGALSQDLEGWIRPHFFDGVALIVNKLLMQTQANIAIFGEKDYQQLIIIKQLVAQLDIPVEIIAAATIRENDGLAFSSRNHYLNAEERQIACQLYQTLIAAKEQLSHGNSVEQVSQIATQKLFNTGFSCVDYIAVRDADTLAPVEYYAPDRQYRILAAATLGSTRLIDNIAA